MRERVMMGSYLSSKWQEIAPTLYPVRSQYLEMVLYKRNLEMKGLKNRYPRILIFLFLERMWNSRGLKVLAAEKV